MIASSQSMNMAPKPNFLLLKEICATILSLDTYLDTKIQFHYDADCHLSSSYHYQDGCMTTAVTYRSNTLDPLRMLVYGADGQLVENHAYSYAENGKLLTITGTDAAGTPFFSKRHCYDRKGMLDYFEVFCNRSLHYWESYRNDPHSLRESFASGDGTGKLFHTLQYQNVMAEGKLLATITLHNEEAQHTVFYNDHGQPVKEVQFDSNRKEKDVTRYTYTEHGKPLLETRAHYGKETYRMEYSYDEAGRLMEIRHIHHGQLEQHVQYTYLDGRLQSCRSFTRGQLDAQYSYIYEPVHICDAQAAILSNLYAKLLKN